MIRTADQQGRFELHPEPDLPVRTPLPVPLAPDGVAFRRAVIEAALAVAKGRPEGYATPSEVRALVERAGVRAVDATGKDRPQWWGGAWGALGTAGWFHSTERLTSRTGTRNAAAEERWYAPWTEQARAAGRPT